MGPTTEATLRKLAAGRIRHAVTGKSFLDYRLKTGDPALAIHPPLVVTSYMGQCAVSPNGSVSVAEVDMGIARMIRNGTVAAITARYR